MLNRVGGGYPPDCSTTIANAYQEATGKTITGSSHAQTALGVSVGRDWRTWQPGDILVYLGGGHTGVYVGDGEAVHAMNEQQGVIKSRVDSDYWLGNFVDARRLPWHDTPTPSPSKPEKPDKPDKPDKPPKNDKEDKDKPPKKDKDKDRPPKKKAPATAEP